MDKEQILAAEASNDGKSVYLYFNEDVGFYTAYGLSAFFVCHLVDPIRSFSTSLGLPCVLINGYQIQELRRSLSKREHIVHRYYSFELKRSIGQSGYEAWAEKAKPSLSL